jgi:hypothetical protein
MTCSGVRFVRILFGFELQPDNYTPLGEEIDTTPK